LKENEGLLCKSNCGFYQCCALLKERKTAGNIMTKVKFNKYLNSAGEKGVVLILTLCEHLKIYYDNFFTDYFLY
jgi:hypothetical protein